MRVRFLPPAPRNAEEYILDNLITIQVTDEQLAELQCLVAERAEDANLLERALAVPIPAGRVADKTIPLWRNAYWTMRRHWCHLESRSYGMTTSATKRHFDECETRGSSKRHRGILASTWGAG